MPDDITNSYAALRDYLRIESRKIAEVLKVDEATVRAALVAILPGRHQRRAMTALGLDDRVYSSSPDDSDPALRKSGLEAVREGATKALMLTIGDFHHAPIHR